MKKLTTILFCLTIHQFGFSQSKFDPKTFDATKINFYGYDFTHFKFVETSKVRESSQIKEHIVAWVAFINEHANFKSLLRVDTANVNMEPTMKKVKSIQAEDLMGYTKYYLPKDSITEWLKQYSFPDKSGVGLIAFVDCFYRPEQKSIITYVFFDISNKNSLGIETIECKGGDGYGLARYWGEAMEVNLGKFMGNYRSQKKDYNKAKNK